MALCTQSDVEMRLQIDFTSATDPVCAALIAAAQGHIEREVGRPIEAAAQSETFDPPDGGIIWLTNTPINSITAVTADTTLLASTQYAHRSDGRLTRVSGGQPVSWSMYKIQSIAVSYNGGYTTPPADLVDLCAWLAADAFRVGANFAALPAGSDGIQSVTLADSDSVTYFTPRSGDWPHSISWPNVSEMLERVARVYRNVNL